MDDVLLTARALVLADLSARGAATAEAVSALEESLSERAGWVEAWPEGAVFVPGLVAQDVQDALFETVGRWPLCRLAGCAEEPEHPLYVQPDLGGPDPTWVCEESGTAVAPLGSLGA
ncbi:hypothetical protein [Nocardioides sp. GY 10127]|uniref:hypothetical protein n=1 Tax=Nocardioides sp. GY 10127 TaxID=2569762 RepID=UPI00197EBC06|nr:hypothetical protein [Nocardioides sp. GY 10127]